MTISLATPTASDPVNSDHAIFDETGFESFQGFDAIGFVDWDLVADKLIWDKGAEERFGVAPGALNSFEAWTSFVHPDDAARVRADAVAVAKQRRDRMSYRYRYRPTPQHDWRIVEGFALCYFDDAGNLIRMTGVACDITRNAADQRALARNEAQLRAILATIPDALLIVDASGIVRDANAAAERMFGLDAARITGVNVNILVPQAARFMPTVDNGAATTGPTPLPNGRRADGTLFPIELNVGEAVYGTDRMYTCFIRDISVRMEEARRADELRNQYMRTARLNLMGTMAAGLAHELNQPLAASANYLATVQLRLANAASTSTSADPSLAEPLSPEAALLEKAAEQIALAGEIIRRLRGFLISGEQQLERLAIPKVINDAVALSLVGRSRVEVVPQLLGPSTTMPDIVADRVQVLQVLANLFRNAAEAMAGLDAPRIQINIEPLGKMTQISVIDNGPGFDPTVLHKSDNLYVSTKGAEGMGVGLMISRRLVEGWGGTLSIGSDPGGGACVSFTVSTASND